MFSAETIIERASFCTSAAATTSAAPSSPVAAASSSRSRPASSFFSCTTWCVSTCTMCANLASLNHQGYFSDPSAIMPPVPSPVIICVGAVAAAALSPVMAASARVLVHAVARRLLGEEPDPQHHADVDGARRQPAPAPVVRERVLVRVARAVVALRPRPGDTHARREEHEEVHVAREVLVEVPAALDLALRRAEELVARHALTALTYSIVEYHGALNDTADPGPRLSSAAVQAGQQLGLVADVALHRRGPNALLLEAAEQLPDGALPVAGAREHQDVPGPGPGHPLGDASAEPAAAAGDDVGRVGPERHRRHARRRREHHVVVARLEHDLADVLAHLHAAEGLLGPRQRERLDGRHGPGDAGAEQVHDLAEDPGRSDGVVVEQVEHVDRVEGDVAQEGLHVELRVADNVLLAQLDEAAEAADAAPREPQRLAGERVEHDVDAPGPGEPHDALRKLGVAAVEDVLGGDAVRCHQELLLLLGRHRREDLCADVLGQDDGRLTHAAGGAVDQQGLPLAKPGHVGDGVVRRAVDDGKRGGGDEVHAVRHELHHGLLGLDQVAHRAELPRHDGVARPDPRDALADAVDDAAAVDPERGLLELAHGDHDVLEVEADAPDPDLDPVVGQRLSGGGGGARVVAEVEGVQAAGGTDGHGQGATLLAEGHLARRRRRVEVGDEVVHALVQHDALHHGHAVPHGHLPVGPLGVLGVAGLAEGLVNGLDHAVRVHRRVVVDVECRETQARILGPDAPRHAGHEVRRRVLAVDGAAARHVDGVAGGQHDAPEGVPVLGRDGREEGLVGGGVEEEQGGPVLQLEVRRLVQPA
ncbi:hypothetical protein ColKHC_08254 [Colletotrichum higginsianum]|nr:hypothetical protein ColKHC_08254 [Colletotrichum higginsianum]